MIDKQKIKLMTKLAMFEQTEGKEALKICEYNKKDYKGMYAFTTFLWVTIGYILLVGLVLLSASDLFLGHLSTSILIMTALIIIVGYFGVLIIYLIICSQVYGQRYQDARRVCRYYFRDLTRLLDYYKKKRR